MSYVKHKLIIESYQISDMAAFLLAMGASAWYTGVSDSDTSVIEFFSMRISLVNVLAILALVLLWQRLLTSAKLYMPLRPNDGFWKELFNIAPVTGLGMLIFAAAGSLFDISLFTPRFLLTFWGLTTVFSVGFRRAALSILRKVNLGDKNHRNILILGLNPQAQEYAEMVEYSAHLGYHFLGFIAPQGAGQENHSRLLGSEDEFEKIVYNFVVDEIVVCMAVSEITPAVEEMIRHAARQGIQIRFPMYQAFHNLFGQAAWRIRPEAMLRPDGGSAPDIVMYSGHQVGWRFIIKRIIDILIATAVLILASPLMLGAALAVGLSSPGGVIFQQDRYGYNGRVFKLYKFRTMVAGAEAKQAELLDQNEMDGGAFKIRNDPRVTKVGTFLRKTSIDELPQLFNVLKGDMSVVGPRPLPLSDYQRINEISYRRRLSVLPGITCTWQAGGRNDISFEDWMRLDMEYIDNWDLLSDFKILFQTIPAVLLGRGSS